MFSEIGIVRESKVFKANNRLRLKDKDKKEPNGNGNVKTVVQTHLKIEHTTVGPQCRCRLNLTTNAALIGSTLCKCTCFCAFLRGALIGTHDGVLHSQAVGVR